MDTTDSSNPNLNESLTPSKRKRWSKPRVILSEIEDTEKLFQLTEITFPIALPTGPS